MSKAGMLATVAAIERERTVAQLKSLFDGIEDGLIPYAGQDGEYPHLEPFGDLRDSLERVSRDVLADEYYGLSMIAAALARVVADQQKRIAELEKAAKK